MYRRSNIRKIVATAAIGVSAAAGIWLLLRVPSAPVEIAARAEEPSKVGPSTPATSSFVAPIGESAAPAAPPRPVIDAIEVEKRSVCRGEENVVRVRAHTTDGTDPFLRVMVGGTAGDEIPVRVFDDGRAYNDWPKVIVTGKDGAVTLADVPRYEVRDCKEAHRLEVSASLVPNARDTYRFVARPAPPRQGGAFNPTSYRWTFGDGSTLETKGPLAEHAFDTGREERLVVSYLVRVEALVSGGEARRGSTALAIRNLAFETLETNGVRLVTADLAPRFPTVDGAGVVRARVQVRATGNRPVVLKRMAYRALSDEGTLGPPTEVDPVTVLGGRVLEPGMALEAPVAFDTHAHAGAVGLEYTLEGIAGGGTPSYGSFTLMAPAPPLGPDAGAPVDDALARKILRAQQLLGTERVTGSELARLEGEGRFADLEQLR